MTQHTFDKYRDDYAAASSAGGAALGSGGDLSSPDRWMTAATVGAILFGARRGKLVVQERVAVKVAEMLTSRDPQVAQRAITQAAHTPVLQALRAADEAFAGMPRGAAVQALIWPQKDPEERR
jgi:hypothetical protein